MRNTQDNSFSEEKSLYQLREVSLKQCGERFTVSIAGEPDAGRTFENPLEAWTLFIDLLDSRVRRRIGDMLEKQGKNRYTGLAEERSGENASR